MKARVKATGEIVELNPYDEIFEKQKEPFKSKKYKICHLEGIEICEEPDYWTKFYHQAAIAAMQGLLSNSAYMENFVKYAVEGDSLVSVATQNAFDYATALVEKLKNEK